MVTVGENPFSTVITCHDDKGIIIFGIEHIIIGMPRTGSRQFGMNQTQFRLAVSKPLSPRLGLDKTHCRRPSDIGIHIGCCHTRCHQQD